MTGAYNLPGPGDLYTGPSGDEDGPDTSDVRNALSASVTFVTEALCEGDLAAIARAWLANDPIEMGRIVGAEVESYLKLRVGEALKGTPHDEACDALRNLEHAYRDEQLRIPTPQAPRPLSLVVPS